VFASGHRYGGQLAIHKLRINDMCAMVTAIGRVTVGLRIRISSKLQKGTAFCASSWSWSQAQRQGDRTHLPISVSPHTRSWSISLMISSWLSGKCTCPVVFG